MKKYIDIEIQSHETIAQVINAVLAKTAVPHKTIADALGLPINDLHKIRGGTKKLPVSLLPAFVEVTGDMSPIYWLVQNFLLDPKDAKDLSLDQLAWLAPRVIELLKEINGGDKDE